MVSSLIASSPAAAGSQGLSPTIQQTAQTFSALTHRVANAIKTAAAKTGVDFSYLLGKAAQESGFNANAKAATSSAAGLYQFTNQTWLRMVKTYGAQHGLGQYANQITYAVDGSAKVDNPGARQTILALRNDPQTSAIMAAELDKENLGALQSNVGGKVGATELYLAHFLGANGASAFLNNMKSAPDTPAANILPEAANVNALVFYDTAGKPRTLAQIYKSFEKKFDAQANAGMVASAEALAGSEHKALPGRSSPSVANISPLSLKHGAADGAQDIVNLSTALAQTAGLPTTVSGGLRSGSSSLFTTMVLAQMGMDSATSAALMGARNSHESHSKKGWGNPLT